LASDRTPWCLTCNTVLPSHQRSFCDACQREYERARKKVTRAADRAAVAIPDEDAKAIHDAKDHLGQAAWALRVALDANVPQRAKIAHIQVRTDAVLLATKDLVWFIDTWVPDTRATDERDTGWRRRLPKPRPEPAEDDSF
jgi:hypothetical protein